MNKEFSVEQFTLKNGLRVVLNEMPYLRSVSVGVWVKAGSILEAPEENGLSHFMEHMAFKGTERRTARQIAEEMDAVGGQLNAATSKLCTNYYVKVIDEDLPLALDMLSDIVVHPKLDEGEFDKERSVILEEISMVADSPEDVVYDVIAEAMFGAQSLGQTILGPAERISSYSVGQLKAYREKHYSPTNAVVALAGNVSRARAEELLNQYFGAWAGSAGEAFPKEAPNEPPRVLCAEKDTEQVHLCLGYRGNPIGSDRVYVTAVLNSVFGGGMSSRLFQRIREELGMAYSVYSGPSSYPFCGDYTIYAATSPKHTKTVLEQIDAETKKLLKEGVTEKEFTQAKAQLRSGFVLGLESSYSRMNSMGGNLILLNRVLPPEETLAGIEHVTPEDVMAVANDILTAPCSAAFVGRKAKQYEPYAGILRG